MVAISGSFSSLLLADINITVFCRYATWHYQVHNSYTIPYVVRQMHARYHNQKRESIATHEQTNKIIANTCFTNTCITNTCIANTCFTNTCITNTCITNACFANTCITNICSTSDVRALACVRRNLQLFAIFSARKCEIKDLPSRHSRIVTAVSSESIQLFWPSQSS